MVMLLGFILHFLPTASEQRAQAWVIKAPFAIKVAVMLAVVIVVIQIKSSEIQPFIYFQF
jgi:hypothetical protein